MTTPDDQRLEERAENARRTLLDIAARGALTVDGRRLRIPQRMERAQDEGAEAIRLLLTTLRERTEALRELQEAARRVLERAEMARHPEYLETALDALSALLPQEARDEE